jgi:predicted GNAT family acetyltransferase
MFRRIIPGREQDALAFLSREPDINYFILGDIECYGLDDPNLSLWVEEKDGGITSALLRYYGSFILYAPGGADARHAARIMREMGFGMLSGRPEYIHPVLEQLKLAPEIHANVFMKLSPGILNPVNNGKTILKVDSSNVEEHIDGIVALRQQITEFAQGINTDALREELEKGCRRIFIAREGGKTVSMAMTTVERRNAAMIVSVCTLAEYRGRGYAPTLMTALCRELEEEGKSSLLFYNNPVAGKIYRALGFEDIGRWCFASF